MTQQTRILEHLRSGKTLTRLESWSELGVLETPSRISELRGMGHQISTTMMTVYNRYGEKTRIAQWRLL